MKNVISTVVAMCLLMGASGVYAQDGGMTSMMHKDHTSDNAMAGGMMNKESAGDHAMVPKALIGAWMLVRCDNVYPDGHRVELYGPNPVGMWLIDADGDYMMQIVRAKRMPFAMNDKSKGTADEYRAASMDSNAHYGHISGDASMIHTQISHASFPNWDGKMGNSGYTINGDELTYRVEKPSSGAAEGAHGEVVWRRVHS
ncbi:lipocalin-like domain-containing protein [Dyella sp. 2HG41-7]|uniref:lipocalin-like domain-containing protein n=1 Tax=Dyella sp. 2HG41-7 TaxID=2883239 RepID=UPI001F1E793F|nr:lipocalin-like domain-containing protein [Dyella sp. 2HG41-7]